jgi:hypothetical protein
MVQDDCSLKRIAQNWPLQMSGTDEIRLNRQKNTQKLTSSQLVLLGSDQPFGIYIGFKFHA